MTTKYEIDNADRLFGKSAWETYFAGSIFDVLAYIERSYGHIIGFEEVAHRGYVSWNVTLSCGNLHIREVQ